MGIYINTEMPKEGTVFVIDSAGQVWSNEWPTRGYIRLDGVTAIPVPPHGRLGDLDKINTSLGAMIEIEHNQSAAPYSWAHAYTEMQSILDDAPTIIPAEEGE